MSDGAVVTMQLLHQYGHHGSITCLIIALLFDLSFNQVLALYRKGFDHFHKKSLASASKPD
jgi:hypothetical protein